MATILRPARAADAAFIGEMLAEAATWDRPAGESPPSLDALLADPQTADYVDGWGREGDAGTIAEVDDEPVGACWFRTFTAERPGYGFIGEDVPGIGLALLPRQRGRGIGTRLLDETIALARDRGGVALSLSVAEANPARGLYLRAGFVEVEREGGSLTMRLDLIASATRDP